MTTCTPIPYVKTHNDERIPSPLWKSIAKHTSNRDEIVDLFLHTKSDEFKEWDPLMSLHEDEPQVFYYDGQPYYLNHNNERKYVFDKSVGIQELTADALLDQIQQKDLINESDLDKFNQSYKDQYNLKNDLVYIEILDEGELKLHINQATLDEINNSKAPDILLAPSVNDLYADIESISLTDDFTTVYTAFKNKKSVHLKALYIRKSEIAGEINRAGDDIAKQEILQNQQERVIQTIKTIEEEIVALGADELDEKKGILGTLDDIDSFTESSNERLQYLVNSKSANDIDEAEMLIRFFELISDMTHKNPLFSKIEIDRLVKNKSKILNRWRENAASATRIIRKKKEGLLRKELQRLPQMRQMYGDKINSPKFIEQILSSARQDTHFFDSWMMSPTNGILSDNGPIPQVLSIELRNSVTRSKNIVNKFERQLQPLLKPMKKVLEENGWTYEMFMQEYNGKKTGRLISRFNAKWYEELEKIEHWFETETRYLQRKMVEAGEVPLKYDENDLKERRRRWYQENSAVVDFMSLSEVVDFIKNDDNLSKRKFHTSSKMFDAESLNISKMHYDEIVAKQIALLKRYSIQYNVQKELFENEGKDVEKEMKAWELQYNPSFGYANLQADSMIDNKKFQVPNGHGGTTTIFNTTDFNVVIPKRKLGYWEDKFENIEKNKVLYDFRNLGEEIYDYISNSIGIEKMDKIMYTEPKSIYDLMGVIFKDDGTPLSVETLLIRLHKAWEILHNMLTRSFTIIESPTRLFVEIDMDGNEISRVNTNGLTQNRKKILDFFETEVLKLEHVYDFKVDKYSIIPVKKIPNEVRMYLKSLDDTLDFTNENEKIEVGRIIRHYVSNKVMEESSINLPLSMLSFLEIAAEYNARKEVEPISKVLIDNYNEIGSIKVNNAGVPITLKNLFTKQSDVDEKDENIDIGKRTNAILQMTDWYKRVIYGNYEEKHFWNLSKVPFVGGSKVLSGDKELHSDLKAIVKNIDRDISNYGIDNPDPIVSKLKEAKTETEELLNSIERKVYVSQGILTLLKALRFKGLAWNINSQVTNFAEGQIANEVMVLQTGFINQNNWYRATGILNKIIRKKFLRFIDDEDVTKTNLLMDNFRVLMDVKNEFQKSLERTSTKDFSVLKPYGLMTQVEFMNQSPLMIGMLMEQTITDAEGNTSSLWDAYEVIQDEHGVEKVQLKKEFTTPTTEESKAVVEKNITNWDDRVGEDHDVFKNKLVNFIINTHGDYDKLGGNMLKSHLAGKALLMFKTWLSRALYVRFATQQDDLQLGIKNFKGRYRSHTAVSAMLHGGVAGMWTGGLIGAGVGAGVGYAIGSYNQKKGAFDGINGENKILSLPEQLQELVFHSTVLTKRLVGMPINRIMGRQISTFDDSDTVEKLMGAGFTENDARNLQANMQDIAFVIGMMILSLVVKSLTWDDDDEQDDIRRQMHNLLVNRLNSLGNQAVMYSVKPDQIVKMFSSDQITVWSFYNDLKKINEDVVKFVNQEDILVSGPNKGKSRLAKDIRKTFLPTSFNTFGFGSQTSRQFEKTPWDNLMWKSDKRIEKQWKSYWAGESSKMIEKLVTERKISRSKAKAIVAKRRVSVKNRWERKRNQED